MVVTQRSVLAYAVIDTEKCKGCRFCISVCARKSIGLAPRINQNGYIPAAIVADGCTGCINCAIMCPEAAIAVYRSATPSGESTS